MRLEQVGEFHSFGVMNQQFQVLSNFIHSELETNNSKFYHRSETTPYTSVHEFQGKTAIVNLSLFMLEKSTPLPVLRVLQGGKSLPLL